MEHIELSNLLDISNKVIRILVLNKNYLRFIPSDFLPPSLEHLMLNENDIHHLELSHPLPNLKTLTIEANKLKYLDLDTQLLSLHTFSAKSNYVSNIDFLLKMPSLKHLNLSKNNIKTLDKLPPSLQSLSANFNKIQMIQSRLPNSLIELDLLGNSLRMGSLPMHWSNNLRVLNLGYNHLKEFPKRLPDSLEDIRLMNNEIKVIPSKLPANLKRLVLSGNRIQQLPVSTNIRLEILILSHNQLTDNFETRPINWVTHLFEEYNWNQFKHHSAQVILKGCWKRYLLKIRLRQFVRSRRIYNELLMVTLHPDHVLQTDTFSPELFRMTQTSCHSHMHL